MNIEKQIENFIKMKKETQSEITKKSISRDQLLSSGSALINLACSDNVHGAFLPGKYYLIVGASSAGKTWLATSIMAESSLHDLFKNYKLIYDNIEDGNEIDLEFYFGAKTVERIKAPRYDKNKEPIFSVTVEDFYDNLNNAFDETEKTGTPFIYILDSQDALTSISEIEKSEDNKELREKGKETTGSYGDGKAKVHSSNLRYVTSRLGQSGSILFIICQERDDIGSRFAGVKTFSGGHALTFYASLQLWLKYKSDLTVTVNKKFRNIGSIASISVKKNRLTGLRHKDIEMPINNNFGMDDIGSSIDYLLEEDYFGESKDEEETEVTPAKMFGKKKAKSKSNKINFEELNFTGTKEELIKYIEENNLESKLYNAVWKCWRDIKRRIQEKFSRKRKYD